MPKLNGAPSPTRAELWTLIVRLANQTGKPHAFKFTRRDLRQASNWQDHRLRDALTELVEMGYLSVAGGCQGKTFTYRLPGELATPDELDRKFQDQTDQSVGLAS